MQMRQMGAQDACGHVWENGLSSMTLLANDIVLSGQFLDQCTREGSSKTGLFGHIFVQKSDGQVLTEKRIEVTRHSQSDNTIGIHHFAPGPEGSLGFLVTSIQVPICPSTLFELTKGALEGLKVALIAREPLTLLGHHRLGCTVDELGVAELLLAGEDLLLHPRQLLL